MKRVLTNSLFLILWLLAAPGLLSQHAWEDVARIVAVGDVHGDFDNFFQVLRQAGIINRRGNWIADDTHLVQLGDLPDRGADTDKAIELLMKLERQAERRGGKVHVLIGNHEAMNMLGDLRYVHPGEFEAFVNRDSERLRDRYFELVVQQRKSVDPEFEASEEFINQFNEQVPLGFVEHRVAWAPEGEYGSWVLEHNAVIKVNDTLFLHAGVGPEVLGMSLDEINDGVRNELRRGESGQIGEPGLATSEGGPLWYRGLAMNDEATESGHVDAVLDFYGVKRIVIGHTPGLATIVPRFDAKVLVIDSGLSAYYGGHLASLTIDGEQVANIQRGELLEIPDNQADLISYFEAVLKLEPGEAALEQHLSTLTGAQPIPAQ
ncbi:MAG: metallophosphoesterase [Gammaproteobacteria bacterium]|nr:metallophosphoesterase [Gammaproteobacteria bacterium]